MTTESSSLPPTSEYPNQPDPHQPLIGTLITQYRRRQLDLFREREAAGHDDTVDRDS